MVTGFSLEIVTPERLVLKEEAVSELTAPGWGGYFGILPLHTPYLVMLSVGILSYRKNSSWYFLSVKGGFAEVLRNRVIILAEVCERAEEIDIKRAEVAKERAEKRIAEKNSGATDIDFDRAEVALKRAISRISAKKSIKYF